MIHPRHPDSNEPVGSQPPAASPPDSSITLHLPPDLAAALHRYSQQSGQSPAAAIVTLLRSTLELVPAADGAAPEPLEAEVRRLQARLTKLEGLIPQVEALEGKCLAF